MASEVSASSLVQASGNGVSPAAKEVVVGAAGGVTQVLIGKTSTSIGIVKLVLLTWIQANPSVCTCLSTSTVSYSIYPAINPTLTLTISDIVKVRMQNRVDGSAFHIARTLWRQEGLRGLYKV